MSSTRNQNQSVRNTATTTRATRYGHPPRYAPRRGVARLARVAGFTLPTLGLILALGGMVALTLGTGCASKKAPAGDSPTAANLATGSPSAPLASALDVHPAPAAPAYAPPQPTITLPADPVIPPAGPAGQDPVLTQTPRLASAGTDLPAGPSAAPAGPAGSAGSAYTVQKGDTLYKIARDHYGNGRQWSRIVAANPGLSPATLKVGQKLNLP